MDNKNIRSILQDAMEKKIPSAQVELWPAVKASLVAGNHRLIQQGEKMNSTKSQPMSRGMLITLTVILLITLTLITPQGRAFAQNILQFFARADQDRYPLQTWQMTPPVQASSESPFKYSVAEAEALAGYDVLSPVTIPPGMIFAGASHDEKYHMVAQAFGQGADYIELSLWQQPLEYYQPCGDISNACDNMPGGNLAGASADIQTVQVGDWAAEYVEGVWELTENGPVWNSTPYAKTLRWKTKTMIFELVYNGMDLTRDDLVTFAGNIR
jgi:hypothetical protein